METEPRAAGSLAIVAQASTPAKSPQPKTVRRRAWAPSSSTTAVAIADEPTGALDSTNGAAVFAVFRRLADAGPHGDRGDA
jgi:hypothetical protein